jgi:hypothetical protein
MLYQADGVRIILFILLYAFLFLYSLIDLLQSCNIPAPPILTLAYVDAILCQLYNGHLK